jgi:hypothetical protein
LAVSRVFAFAEEQVDPETQIFDYQNRDSEGPRRCWYRMDRRTVQKLMRLAFEAGADYLVESLKKHWEATAQRHA